MYITDYLTTHVHKLFTVFCCFSMRLPCIIIFSGMGPDFRVLVRKSRKQAQQYYRLYKVVWQFIWCTLSFYLTTLTQKCPYECDMQYIYLVILLKLPIPILNFCTSFLFYLSKIWYGK